MTLRSPVLALLPPFLAAALVLVLAPGAWTASLAAAGLLVVTAGLSRLAEGATGRVLGVVALVLLLRLGGAVAVALFLPDATIPAYALGLGLGVLADGALMSWRLPRLAGSPA